MMKNTMNANTTTAKLDATTRERMLQVSTKLFATKGYDRVSVREIAKACKCNLSMISYYFGGKEKLYIEIFERFFERVYSQIQTLEQHRGPLDKPMSREEFVNEIGLNIRFFISEFKVDPYAKIVLHREVMDGFPRAKAAFERHFANVRSRLLDFYERAQKSGCIKKNIHIPTFVVLINRCVESYLVAHLFAKPIRDLTIDPLQETDEFVNQLEEIFLRGVLS